MSHPITVRRITMRILDTMYHINKSAAGYLTNLFTEKAEYITSENYDGVNKIYRIMRTGLSNETKKEYISNVCRKYGYNNLFNALAVTKIINDVLTPEVTEEKPATNVDVIKATLNALTNFFTEFEFEPNFRFVNTLFRMTSKSTSAGKVYITNYFKLIDSPNALSIKEKMKSAEFTQILESIKSIGTSKQINSRFKLYYGSQGTGKTTQAMKESNGRCMVCHSAMLPSDLMEDFKFNDGKAEFIPSALQNAMVNGEIITLDEINLLPFESLRFLQSILDGKASFEYKGKTINIKEGFKIIGTMNLQVNGSIYSLPEPLVDRAEELREYKLTADNLIGAVI